MFIATTILASAATLAADTKGQSVDARRAKSSIILDGRLDEPDWRAAPPMRRFYEIYPNDRSIPSEKTEARFLYDARFLYVGIRAFLRDPRKLRAPFVRRDKVNHSQDYVQVYLDPLDSGRGSYLFRVNARGSKADVVQDEDKGTEDSDPDFPWDVATSIDNSGWSAELRIPLSTLRINRRGGQNWKVIVYRGVPRKDNVQIATAPIPRVANCFLCYAGELHFADLQPQSDDLLISPSFAGILRRDQQVGQRRTTILSKPSLDVKWLPSPGTAVDLTVRPDFIQVEPDQPQLTSNARFAINLPEKRPFFREGSDLTQTPIPLLYTRTVLEPNVGVRLTTRSSSFSGTVFMARDVGKGGIVEPGFLNSNIAYPDNGSLVLFARSRFTVGSYDPGLLIAMKRNDDGSYNMVGGPDISWGGEADRVTAQASFSETRNPDRPDLVPNWRGQTLGGLGITAEWTHTGSHLVSTARYSLFTPGFRAWLGYVPRVGSQELFGRAEFSNTFSGVLDEFSPYISYDRIAAVKDRGLEHDAAVGVVIGAALNTTLDLSLHPDAVVLNEQGQPQKTRFVQFSASTNLTPWLPNLGVTGQIGRLVDFTVGDTGDAVQATIDAELRPIDRFDLAAHVGITRIGNLPDARGPRLNEVTTQLTATWFFSPRLYLLVDAQRYRSTRHFPDETRSHSNLVNVQLSYEINRDFDIYAGLREGTNLDSAAADPGRQTEVYFKLSRTFHPRLKGGDR